MPWRFTLLGYKAGFAQPWFLVGTLVALLLGVVAIVVSARRARRLSAAVPRRLAEVLAPGVSTVLPSLQSSAYTAALFCFALALAQPQCGERAEVAKRRGIDVVVALDASKSMYARDVTPSRLERAKLELTTLLDTLKGDRVGIVAFAGDAFIQCPLTSDYSAAKLFLRAVDPESMPQGGTNIGAALLLSRQVLENADRGAKDRVVVLLSDGEDLTGDITEGVQSLKDFGARVLAVGIGSDTGEPIPVLNKNGDVVGYKKDESGVTVISRLDRAGLLGIASSTGGEFFTEPRGVAMEQVVRIIDSLQKSELESRVTMKYGEAYQPFVAVGLAFLVMGLLLVPSWRRARSGAAVVLVALCAAGNARAAGPLEANHPEAELGTQAYEAQRFDEALSRFDKALQDKPSDPRAHYNRALALYKLGRNDEAKAAFQAALDLDRTGELAGKVHYNLGNVAASTGDKAQAVKEYRAALREDPTDPLARHNLEVLLKNLPPQQPQSGGDAGTPDAGGNDGGRPDAGQDGGTTDGGSDAGQPDGGRPDGGGGDGGSGDAGMDAGADAGQGQGDGGQGDGGSGDGGAGQKEQRGDGGASQDSQPGDAGADGGAEQRDAGTPQQLQGDRLPDGGVDLERKDAEKLLDSLKTNERNLQLWRFKQKSPKSDPHGKDW
jgi:Ca-activated chloride channel family protein